MTKKALSLYLGRVFFYCMKTSKKTLLLFSIIAITIGTLAFFGQRFFAFHYLSDVHSMATGERLRCHDWALLQFEHPDSENIPFLPYRMGHHEFHFRVSDVTNATRDGRITFFSKRQKDSIWNQFHTAGLSKIPQRVELFSGHHDMEYKINIDSSEPMNLYFRTCTD
ncbi:hypothetical protein [Sulfidibacter corallicola]|uniref:Uncharacterized protein n=1 Tax=Sulfidibacter corallicola TaxID=2818388 RepID=A0A8A4U041_SULCO|nr:hypothetical protein [Sulfidibacter corallicola]QTD52115.1 hypothetical protein J3U87_06540 [Sulfidibacter corallicola]